jgi:hypothetical protein
MGSAAQSAAVIGRPFPSPAFPDQALGPRPGMADQSPWRAQVAAEPPPRRVALKTNRID